MCVIVGGVGKHSDKGVLGCTTISIRKTLPTTGGFKGGLFFLFVVSVQHKLRRPLVLGASFVDDEILFFSKR